MADLPLEQLKSTSIHERVDALRQIGKGGEHDLVEHLMYMAQTDLSSAVRLGAAGAAADILSRYRVGSQRTGLPLAARKKLLASFKGLDPKVNPGLFMVLACLDLPTSLDRIRVGLRDPRWDVRQGAVVGLRRYCTSWSVSGDANIQRRVLALLEPAGRLPEDSVEGVIGVCAECGWEDARPLIEARLGEEGSMGGAAQAAIERLDQLLDSRGLRGAWFSLGLDASEINLAPRPHAWLLLGDGCGFIGQEGKTFKLVTDWKSEAREALRVKVSGRWKNMQVRRLWLLRLDTNTAGPVLQFEERTYYRAEAHEFSQLIDRISGSLNKLEKGKRVAVVDAILPFMPEDISGQCDMARLEIISGRPSRAVARLEKIIANRKRPAANVWFFLGEALHAGRKKKEAAKAWKTYLDKAGKRGEHVQTAKERLGQS